MHPRRAACRGPDVPQLGPGAAIHISNQAEPVGAWLKAGGTVEGAGIAKALPPTLLAALRVHAVTSRCGCVQSLQCCMHFCWQLTWAAVLIGLRSAFIMMAT